MSSTVVTAPTPVTGVSGARPRAPYRRCGQVPLAGPVSRSSYRHLAVHWCARPAHELTHPAEGTSWPTGPKAYLLVCSVEQPADGAVRCLHRAISATPAPSPSTSDVPAITADRETNGHSDARAEGARAPGWDRQGGRLQGSALDVAHSPAAERRRPRRAGLG